MEEEKERECHCRRGQAHRSGAELAQRRALAAVRTVRLNARGTARELRRRQADWRERGAEEEVLVCPIRLPASVRNDLKARTERQVTGKATPQLSSCSSWLMGTGTWIMLRVPFEFYLVRPHT